MKEYIFEKIKDTTKFFKFGSIPVNEIDPLPDNINLSAIFKALEQNLPPHYFAGLEGVFIQHSKEFDEREVNAVYRDKKFYITNQQDNTADLMDDLVHEFAHHMEIVFPEKIYADQSLIKEFEKKRQQLKFELQSDRDWETNS